MKAVTASIAKLGPVPKSALLLSLGIFLVGLYRGLLPLQGIRSCQMPGNAAATNTPGQPSRAAQDGTVQRWQDTRDCPIYFLDLNRDVAPTIGIPECDINDPEVWPLASPGQLPWAMQRMESMQHYHYQYAGQYWLNEALRNASGVLTDSIDDACLVWVDTYCYNQWHIIQRAIKLRNLSDYAPSKIDVRTNFAKALDYVVASERFQRRQGRDYVFHIPVRDTLPKAPFINLCGELLWAHTLVAEHSSSCRRSRPKVPWRETQVLPYCTVAEVDLEAPIVGSERPTFLYMQATCGKDQSKNCGKLMRYQLARAYNNSDADLQVKCSNIPKEPKSYSQVQQEMRRSLFCLLPPGDTSSSNRLTEVILAGCIPVFIGEPWHEMPFNHGEVDYASMAVFLNITEAPWLDTAACEQQLQWWYQTADVRYATVAVPDFDAALAFLRAMPREAVERRQAALERERPKFFYGVAPGRDSSALADIVFDNLMSYGRRLKAGEFIP